MKDEISESGTADTASDLREAVARAIHGATVQASEYGELPWRWAEERRKADAAIAVATPIIERRFLKRLIAESDAEHAGTRHLADQPESLNSETDYGPLFYVADDPWYSGSMGWMVARWLESHLDDGQTIRRPRPRSPPGGRPLATGSSPRPRFASCSRISGPSCRRR